MLSKLTLKKEIAVFVALILAVSALTVVSFAAGKEVTKPEKESDPVVTAQNNPENKINKDETVYVLAEADGSVKKIIVSDWIQNKLGAQSINDKSDLKDIRNLKGDDSYVIGGDHMKIWNADGKDLYYQGTTDKKLPVNLKLTYKLDGKAIKSENLAGKSGKVTIRIDYTNNQTSTVMIDGKEEKLSVPFVMLSGMLLDGQRFSNVTVSNGRLLNDGDRIAVIGFALPGLQDNLQLEKDTFEFPDYVEINADVRDFKLSTVMTVATNGLFNEIDTSKFDKMDGISEQIKQLSDGMRQLLDGSSALYGGLSELLSKSDDLISGINKLYEGANTLKDGTNALSDGLGTLVSHNTDLNDGAKQVFDTLLSTVSGELAKNGITTEKLTVENYKTVLSSLLKTPTNAQKAQLIAVADAEIKKQLSAAQVPDEMISAVKVMLFDAMQAGKTKDRAMTEVTAALQNAAVVKAVGANSAITPDTTVFSTLTGVGSDTTTAGLLAKLCTYLAGANQNMPIQNLDAAKKMAADAVTLQAAAADTAASVKSDALCLGLALETLKPTVESAMTQLENYQTFYNGILEYTAGAKEAYEGSLALKNGMSTLVSGVGDLKTGSNKLVSGVQQLTDGSKKLADSLKELNEKGIQKIVELGGEKLPTMIKRLKATIEISKSYKSFSGLADDSDGEVKFIYKTDEIK